MGLLKSRWKDIQNQCGASKSESCVFRARNAIQAENRCSEMEVNRTHRSELKFLRSSNWNGRKHFSISAYCEIKMRFPNSSASWSKCGRGSNLDTKTKSTMPSVEWVKYSSRPAYISQNVTGAINIPFTPQRVDTINKALLHSMADIQRTVLCAHCTGSVLIKVE